MERIREFNFPISNMRYTHNEDQRWGKIRNKAHCRISKQNPVFCKLRSIRKGFYAGKWEYGGFTQSGDIAGGGNCLHNAFCLTIGPLHCHCGDFDYDECDDDDNKKDKCHNNDDGYNDDDDQQQALHAQHLLSHDACTSSTSLTSGRCVHSHTIAKGDQGGLRFRRDWLSSLAL